MQALDDCQHPGGFGAESGRDRRCDDADQRRGRVSDGICRLKGDEEVVGGFDLIYKGKDVTLPEASIYTSMLGCRVNRLENMRKLARSCAYRLSKEFLEAEAARLRQETKKK